MLAGELYDPLDLLLPIERGRAQLLFKAPNDIHDNDREARRWRSHNPLAGSA